MRDTMFPDMTSSAQQTRIAAASLPSVHQGAHVTGGSAAAAIRVC